MRKADWKVNKKSGLKKWILKMNSKSQSKVRAKSGQSQTKKCKLEMRRRNAN